MAYETITFDVSGKGVATLTLNRPQALNSFNYAMFREWDEVVDRCVRDSAIRVLVITGSGRAFSSGMDLSVLKTDAPSPEFRHVYRKAHQSLDAFEALEKPVIAAINGLCYGGGLELALSCDILIASDAAKFCLPENQLGVIPASGACNRLIYYVGLAKTKEMIISGEPIDAAEALRIGLVNRVSAAADLTKDVTAYAEKLAAKAPLAMGMGKHVVNLCLNTDMHTGRYLERLGQSVLVFSDDHKEGIAAFREKRKPAFKGK
jgi:enoyl-CoA hydratase/carnithine racemase